MRANTYRVLLLAVLSLLLPAIIQAQLPYRTSNEGMAPKMRELWFYGMRSYPFGRIPQNARQDALNQARTLTVPFSKRSSGGLQSLKQWRAIGPFNVGGRINSIATHPTDGKTLWIGAADGGIWKSTDNGQTWRAVMDDQNSIAMGAIAVANSNPQILYAGTGEQTSNVDSYSGAGIMKSTNGGESWKQIGLTTVGAFSRIVVDPGNDQVVLAGGTKNNGGLYRSVDGGVTWARTFTTNVADITMNPKNSSEIWVSTWGEGIFHSTDGGQTLTASNSGLGQPDNSLNRISVQVAPSKPTVLYALVLETSGSSSAQTNYANVYKSTNSGASWTLVYNNFQNFLSDQGWYNNVIAVKPDDPNVVLCGGVDIIRSENGGASWSYIDSYAGALHPDQHSMAFDPSNPDRLYVGNDGGMWLSEDAGQNYDKICNGLAVSQFYAMAIDQSVTTRTYGGTQDNGTIATQSQISGELAGGDGFYVSINYDDPSRVYGENYNGSLFRLTLNNGNVVSTERIGNEFTDQAAWSAPILIHPTNPQILLAGRSAVWSTEDGGDSWSMISPVFHGLVSALGISPKNPDLFYAGSDRGEVLVSADGGNNWTNVTNGTGLPNRAITDFAPSATDANTCYVTTSGFYAGHVFKTTDAGQSWHDISQGLPDIPTNAIALHPDDEKIIYVGTDIGMFITVDGGATWSTYNEGLPRVAVADLEVHKSSKTLRMASHGRSMWEIDLEKPTFSPSITSPAGGEIWTVGTPHPLSWIGFDGAVKIELSTDDGATWGPTIASNVVGNYLRWITNGTPTEFARIRVTSVTTSTISAVSRSFAIQPYREGTVLAATTKPGIPYGLTFDGEYLWSTDFGSNLLMKLDPVTLTTVAAVELDKAVGDSLFTDITYNPKRGTLFLHRLLQTTGSPITGVLEEITKDGHKVNQWTSPCNYPIGLAYIDEKLDGGPFLMATERDGNQNIYLFDPDNPGLGPQVTFPRTSQVKYGPRGAAYAQDGKNFYQVITDFTGESLQSAFAYKMTIDEVQTRSCSLPLVSPTSSGYFSARGIEYDPSDKNLWVTDYSGNIYKIASCDGAPPIQSAVPGAPAIPEGMRLAQNHPNPFSGTTEIGFTLPKAGHAVLRVYDVSGRTVATLGEGDFPAGTNSISFAPVALPSGLYRYALTTGDGVTLSGTMIYVR